MPHLSDSSVQQKAEAVIRRRVAEHVDKPLAAKTLQLDTGAPVQVDGVAADESLFVEIFAHQGALKGGQRHKIATDALKLIAIGRSRPDAQLILAFADDAAAAFATKGTWMAEALAAWGVKVLVVELDESVREGIKTAAAGDGEPRRCSTCQSQLSRLSRRGVIEVSPKDLQPARAQWRSDRPRCTSGTIDTCSGNPRALRARSTGQAAASTQAHPTFRRPGP